VTPGITIRDRLRVLLPGDQGNYYNERDLIPPDLKGALNQAQIIITNYHSFLLRDAKEIKGVSANTRKMLLAGKKRDPFRETPDAMVARVLRNFGAGAAKGKNEIMVFNDEAHHCYQDKPVQVVQGPKPGALSREEKDANEAARVWFRGIQAIVKRAGGQGGVRPVGDPVLPIGVGLQRGLHLPLDGQRLLADGRDRVGNREDPAYPGR